MHAGTMHALTVRVHVRVHVRVRVRVRVQAGTA